MGLEQLSSFKQKAPVFKVLAVNDDSRAFRAVASDLTSGLSQAGGPLHSQPEAGTAHPQDVKWQKFCDRHWGGATDPGVYTAHLHSVPTGASGERENRGDGF